MEQTELAMINTLLIQIGEAPLNEKDLSHPDVRSAVRIIADVNREVQAKVWWYNTEMWELAPQTNGDIFLPGASTGVLTGNTAWVKRGRKLYDLVRHSFDFSDEDTVEVDVISAWALEELPPTMYVYMLAICKKRMQVGFDFDINKVADLEADVQVAFHNVQVLHLKFTSPNSINQSVAQQVMQNFAQR